MAKKPINLDANATYGLLSEVVEGLCSENSLTFYNPSSIHSGGQRARALIEETRELVLLLFGVSAREAIVVFTSGATESNNAAILAPFMDKNFKGFNEHSNEASLVSSVVEHPSVFEPIKRLELMGLRVSLVGLRNGMFSADSFIEETTASTKVVSLMMANNETGAIFPVERIASAVKERFPQVFFHSDAVQLAGKSGISLSETAIDAVSFSGHKLGALCGVGGLVIKRSALLSNPNGFRPILFGGAQEQKWRAGTENVVGILSLNLALKKILPELEGRARAMRQRKHLLKQKLMTGLEDITINYDREETSLPNTLSLRVEGVNADDLVVALDLSGVLISSGSACSSGKPEPSHVLKAMGLTESQARQSIRLSLRAEEPLDNINIAGEKIINTIKAMRTASCYQPKNGVIGGEVAYER
jgi:cysteine desulfurase